MMLYHCLVQSVHSTLLGMLGTEEEMTWDRKVSRLVRVNVPVTICKFVKNSVGQSVLLEVLRTRGGVSCQAADEAMHAGDVLLQAEHLTNRGIQLLHQGRQLCAADIAKAKRGDFGLAAGREVGGDGGERRVRAG